MVLVHNSHQPVATDEAFNLLYTAEASKLPYASMLLDSESDLFHKSGRI